MKKIHKMGRMYSKFYGWGVRPLCKVDNKGAYRGIYYWGDVTCVNCLKQRKNQDEKATNDSGKN